MRSLRPSKGNKTEAVLKNEKSVLEKKILLTWDSVMSIFMQK